MESQRAQRNRFPPLYFYRITIHRCLRTSMQEPFVDAVENATVPWSEIPYRMSTSDVSNDLMSLMLKMVSKNK